MRLRELAVRHAFILGLSFSLFAFPQIEAAEKKNSQSQNQLEDARRTLNNESSDIENTAVQAGKVYQGSTDHETNQSLLKFGKGIGSGGLANTYTKDSGSPLFSKSNTACPEGAVTSPSGDCVAGEDATPEECQGLAAKAKSNLLLALVAFLGAAALIGAGILLGWTGVGLGLAIAGAVALMLIGAMAAYHGTASKEELKRNAACGLVGKSVGTKGSDVSVGGMNWESSASKASSKSAAGESASSNEPAVAAAVSGDCLQQRDAAVAECNKLSDFNSRYECRRAADKKYEECLKGGGGGGGGGGFLSGIFNFIKQKIDGFFEGRRKKQEREKQDSAEIKAWNDRTSGKDVVGRPVCDGKAGFITDYGLWDGVPCGMMGCVKLHEESHIADMKSSYPDACGKGQKAGELPRIPASGVDSFTQSTECKAHVTVGLPCLNKLLTQDISTACKNFLKAERNDARDSAKNEYQCEKLGYKIP